MRKTFTLIELLVVIAIIAVLAGMLLPALARARMQAVTIACVGNQKQIQLAFMMYAPEWDEALPPQISTVKQSVQSEIRSLSEGGSPGGNVGPGVLAACNLFGSGSPGVTRLVRGDEHTTDKQKRPEVLRCPADLTNGWAAPGNTSKNWGDYAYPRDSTDNVIFGGTNTINSFNAPFSRLTKETLTFCVTADSMLRNGVDAGRPLPVHDFGITVSRANGAAGRVALADYMKGTTPAARLKLIDDAK